MVFSSILFLFFYLPVCLLIYRLAPLRLRNLVLLLFSLAFYGWGEPVYILIMVLSILIDYTHGMLVEKYRANDRKARAIVASSVIFNLALLLFFKYYDFIVTNLSLLPGISIEPLGLSLPIGISFYTFQTMSYTIDVYRQDARAQKNIISFGTYVTLFPQLIAGPIVRYKTVAGELLHRDDGINAFAEGVQIFLSALPKKYCSPTPSENSGKPCPPIPLAHFRLLVRGLACWPSDSRSTLIFPDILTWLSVLAGCLVFTFQRTLTIPTSPSPLRNFGADGISPSPPGFANMSTFHSVETGVAGVKPSVIWPLSGC